MLLAQTEPTGNLGPPVVMAIILWGILIGALAWALATLWFKYRQGRRRPSLDDVRSWPVTSASIIECSVHMLGTGGAREKDEAYYPAVRYEFEVDGEMYTEQAPVGIAGTRRLAGTRTEAEGSLRDLAIGGQIQVRYDPEDPTESRLFGLTELD